MLYISCQLAASAHWAMPSIWDTIDLKRKQWRPINSALPVKEWPAAWAGFWTHNTRKCLETELFNCREIKAFFFFIILVCSLYQVMTRVLQTLTSCLLKEPYPPYNTFWSGDLILYPLLIIKCCLKCSLNKDSTLSSRKQDSFSHQFVNSIHNS